MKPEPSKETTGLTRRDFIRVGTTGATALALTGLGALQAAEAETAAPTMASLESIIEIPRCIGLLGFAISVSNY